MKTRLWLESISFYNHIYKVKINVTFKIRFALKPIDMTRLTIFQWSSAAVTSCPSKALQWEYYNNYPKSTLCCAMISRRPIVSHNWEAFIRALNLQGQYCVSKISIYTVYVVFLSLSDHLTTFLCDSGEMNCLLHIILLLIQGLWNICITFPSNAGRHNCNVLYYERYIYLYKFWEVYVVI